MVANPDALKMRGEFNAWGEAESIKHRAGGVCFTSL
jgi:hypothetical protein